MRPIPVAFHLGPLVVHSYGIGLAVTFLLAYRYFWYRLQKNGYSIEWLTGVFIWTVVAAVVGARALHVLANISSYKTDPLGVFAIWQGGLSSFGGLIGGGVVGVVLLRRRYPVLGVGKALDLVAPVLVAAWGVGRLLGPQLMVAGGGSRTTAWYGMYYAGQVGKRVPVPIIQSIDCFVIFGVLLLIEHYLKRRPVGFVALGAAALWGLARFLEEYFFLRQNDHLGSWLVEGAGLAMFAVGAVVMEVLWFRYKRSEHLVDA